MTRLTKDRGSLKHDDRIDVLAMSVEYWSSRMAVDPAKAEEDYRRKKLDEELRRFMQAGGILWKPERKRWATVGGHLTRKQMPIRKRFQLRG